MGTGLGKLPARLSAGTNGERCTPLSRRCVDRWGPTEVRAYALIVHIPRSDQGLDDTQKLIEALDAQVAALAVADGGTENRVN